MDRKLLTGRHRLLGVLLALAAVSATGIVPLRSQSSPASPHGRLSVGCEECHSPEGWRPLRRPLPFDHGRQTGFPLIQSHKGVSCLGCHSDLRFAFVPTACADFPKEIIAASRSSLESRYNLVRLTEMPKGGHFAAFEQPELFVTDVREFFRTVRAGGKK